MAAIPPYREDPPVGTGGVVPPRQEHDAAPENGAPPAPEVEQSPALPKDWSPVTPRDSGDTAPPIASPQG